MKLNNTYQSVRKKYRMGKKIIVGILAHVFVRIAST